jgi:hypothetical protein
MVIGRIALALARFAARRWSNSEAMLREWSAELHQLAAQGERAQMLRFGFRTEYGLPYTPPFSSLAERGALRRPQPRPRSSSGRY